jgi:hypothetical protein
MRKKTISQENMGWLDVMKRSRRRDLCHSIIDKEFPFFRSFFNYIDKYLRHLEGKSKDQTNQTEPDKHYQLFPVDIISHANEFSRDIEPLIFLFRRSICA